MPPHHIRVKIKIISIICSSVETVQDRVKDVIIHLQELHTSFWVAPHQWHWMTLKALLSVILRYSTEFG